MSSPKRPSGHLGHRSPRKKRIVDLQNETAWMKLRSPVKRSMRDLNELAVKRAIQIKFRDDAELEDDDDIEVIEDQDQALADKIIALSRADGLEPMYSEEEDEGEDANDFWKGSLVSPEVPVTPRKRGGLLSRRSPSSVRSMSPASTRSLSSPSKRRSPSRNLSSKLEDLKLSPTKVKLMKIPDLHPHEDKLLQEGTGEPKSLYYDGFEGFFEQQKLRVRKGSTNSMTMAPQLSYDEFHRFNLLLDLACPDQVENLTAYYRQQYTQWLFELEEDFNLVFYGVGSKRLLLLDFVRKFLLKRLPRGSKCVVANGYNSELHPRTLLQTIWKMMFKKRPPTWHMVESVQKFKAEFNRHDDDRRLVILLHNIDGESLRQDKYHYILSELAELPQVHLVCSMDNMNTALFWNSSMMSSFNFIWHNVTTYQPYTTEISFKDPLSIGKSNEFVGSRGAKFVLGSLTSNAKNLYKNLLIQQLEKIDASLTSEKEMEGRGLLKGNVKLSIVFRDFYDLCVSEFITSNEISFRTVLREFVEHKMCNLLRNTAGTEVLYVPFTVDEMEKILEEELLEA